MLKCYVWLLQIYGVESTYLTSWKHRNVRTDPAVLGGKHCYYEPIQPKSEN